MVIILAVGVNRGWENILLTGGVLRGGEGHFGLLLGVFFAEKTLLSKLDCSGLGTGDFFSTIIILERKIK